MFGSVSGSQSQFLVACHQEIKDALFRTAAHDGHPSQCVAVCRRKFEQRLKRWIDERDMAGADVIHKQRVFGRRQPCVQNSMS